MFKILFVALMFVISCQQKSSAPPSEAAPAVSPPVVSSVVPSNTPCGTVTTSPVASIVPVASTSPLVSTSPVASTSPIVTVDPCAIATGSTSPNSQQDVATRLKHDPSCPAKVYMPAPTEGSTSGMCHPSAPLDTQCVGADKLSYAINKFISAGFSSTDVNKKFNDWTSKGYQLYECGGDNNSGPFAVLVKIVDGNKIFQGNVCRQNAPYCTQ